MHAVHWRILSQMGNLLVSWRSKMNKTNIIYKQYRVINDRIAKGEKFFFKQGPNGCFFSSTGPDGKKNLRLPAIGIYMGIGTSHSCLWFADLFERMGFYNLIFLDEKDIRENGLTGLDVLAMSGGDTFSIAEGLGEAGAAKIKNFVASGGLYLGSCAGAYLPLNSSKKHLNRFNFVSVKINNLTKTLPEAERMAGKFCTPYGCSFIFHPVREDVRLKTTGIPPFAGMGTVTAPLYGGPSLIASNEASTLACYDSFTNKTTYLVNEELARETLIGNVAAVKTVMGGGCFYLFGPHFEHPGFPEANKLVIDAIYWENPAFSRDIKIKHSQKSIILNGRAAKNLLMNIKRELSNSRITAYGMEMLPVQWQIGNKVYEPEKIRVFIEAMWTRIKSLERRKNFTIPLNSEPVIEKTAKTVTELLRDMKQRLDQQQDTTKKAEKLFHFLKILTQHFLNIYFSTIQSDYSN